MDGFWFQSPGSTFLQWTMVFGCPDLADVPVIYHLVCSHIGEVKRIPSVRYSKLMTLRQHRQGDHLNLIQWCTMSTTVVEGRAGQARSRIGPKTGETNNERLKRSNEIKEPYKIVYHIDFR